MDWGGEATVVRDGNVAEEKEKPRHQSVALHYRMQHLL